MRALDWPATGFGHPEKWPENLRTAVRLCLTSRFPILIWWGPEFRILYNDAYVPFLGPDKHPRYLTRPGRECWEEIWDVIGPMLAQVRRSGVATWSEDSRYFFVRTLPREEVYVTFTYGPILAANGKTVEGIFCPCTETTGQIVGARRLETLRRLGTAMGGAPSATEACRAVTEVLAGNPYDIPFAALYMPDESARTALLQSSAGIAEDAGLLPPAVPLTGGGKPDWPFAAAVSSRRSQELDLAQTGLELPGGAWPEPAPKALVAPVLSASAQTLAVLVLGTSPRRPLDASYRAFFELVATGTGTVISAAAAYEEETKRAEALAEFDRAKTEFFSNVSHEFRTPLTLLLAPLEELLADGAPALTVREREQIAIAHANGLRLLKLVNNLLDFARVDARRDAGSPVPADLAALTEDLVSMFRSAFSAAGIELATVIDPVGVLDIDTGMWETVVLNLLSNALKHTPSGSVRVGLRRYDQVVELTVTDTGVGITPEDREHIFDRFFRSADEAARSFEGSGIGLALVFELLRLHQGSITVDSEPGAGSTFTVMLPAHDSAGEPGRPVASHGSSSAKSRSFLAEAARWAADTGLAQQVMAPAADHRPSVLVADDNGDMRAYLCSILEPEWHVVLAANGREALQMAQRARPDVVLSDVMMPGLDGLGLVDRLRAEEPLRDVPVLLLSARAGPEAAADGLEHGADDYVVKPFTAAELRARLRALRDAHSRVSVMADQERAQREAADRMAALAAALNSARTFQGIADGVSATVGEYTGAAFVVLSTVEHDEPYLRRYFAGGPLSGHVRARYLRTSLAEDTHTTRAINQDTAVLYRDRGAYALQFPRLMPDVHAIGMDAIAVLPLHRAAGTVMGALAFVWDRPYEFSDDLTTALHNIADMVSRAGEKAEILALEQGVSQRLHDLLTIDIRSTQVIVRTRHWTPGTMAEVGGDWYDTIELPDRRITVVIGDAVGHGLPAAATMTRLHGALGVAAHQANDPAEALTILDRYAQALPGAHCTTVAVATIDPAQARMQYACAGHPPPLLVTPGGGATYLDDGRSWPLGIDAQGRCTPPAQAPFPPGALLLLYTDGLIERRNTRLDDGFDRLIRIVSDHWNMPLRRIKHALFTHLIEDSAAEDDIAIVAVRAVGATPDLFCDVIRAQRTEQRPVRHRLAAWLDDIGTSAPDRDAFILATGEAIANAIDHGSHGDPRRIVTIEAARTASGIIASIGDSGQWQPGLEGLMAGRGRGHLVMEALADDIDIDLSQHGTVVTLQLTRQGQPA